MIDRTDVRLYRHDQGRAVRVRPSVRREPWIPAATTRSARGDPTWSRRPAATGSTRSRSRRRATGAISGREIRATPETLRRQAAIARASGRAPLAENLERAAELARVPDDELLAIYTALRPHRSTADELERLGRAARRLGRAAHGGVRARGRRRLRRAGAPCRLSSSDRFASRAEKELRRELIISPMPELGLVAAERPERPRARARSSRTASSRAWTAATPPTST